MGTNFQMLMKAMINANYEAKNFKDSELTGSPLFPEAENYAAGYDDPQEMWSDPANADFYANYSGNSTVTGIGIRDGEAVIINGNSYGNLVSQNFGDSGTSYTTDEMFALLDNYVENNDTSAINQLIEAAEAKKAEAEKALKDAQDASAQKEQAVKDA
jgi:hypothetical protein